MGTEVILDRYMGREHGNCGYVFAFQAIIQSLKISNRRKKWNWTQLIDFLYNKEVYTHHFDIIYPKLPGFSCVLPRPFYKAGQIH